MNVAAMAIVAVLLVGAMAALSWCIWEPNRSAPYRERNLMKPLEH